MIFRYVPTDSKMITEDRPVKKMFANVNHAQDLELCSCLCETSQRGSIPEGIKLAEKPPDTPANAAAIPARG